ncbi:hypothetical protein A8B73_04770 [Methylosinus sp. 3S-1]|nr:hypothetical protein A8B73_04770 [Methylosinus sp. 3S-1]
MHGTPPEAAVAENYKPLSANDTFRKTIDVACVIIVYHPRRGRLPASREAIRLWIFIDMCSFENSLFGRCDIVDVAQLERVPAVSANDARRRLEPFRETATCENGAMNEPFSRLATAIRHMTPSFSPASKISVTHKHAEASISAAWARRNDRSAGRPRAGRGKFRWS